MKIRKNSWHYKIYKFNSQLCAAWRGKDFYYEWPKDKNDQVGLCPYMRMILIWGPLVMLTYTIPIGALGFAMFHFPMQAGGIAGLGWLMLVIFGDAVIIALIAWRANMSEETDYEEEHRKREERKKQIEENPGFLRLAWHFLVALKTKICPVLEVEK